MPISIRLGNFLYNRAFFLYRPLYRIFKNRQDAFEIEILKRYIRPGDNVLDIGANIGFYASILSKFVGKNGTVHCFEPDERNFKRLSEETKDLPNVYINNKAVGPRSEKITIYTSGELNVDHRTYRPETYKDAISIDAVSIDDYVRSGSLAKIDLIKMDIQGFEMQAIAGMEKTLENNKSIRIVSEFWPYGLSTAGSSVSEYFQWLSRKGFNCYLMQKRTLVKLDDASVRRMVGLSKEHYFNIFATRENV